MPRRVPLIQPSHDTLVGRVAWLCHKLWQGKQIRMAMDLGVHQGSISNILRGKRPPGREFLGLLGAHALVNQQWLMEGLGEPLVTQKPQSSSASLPVARRPFRGVPSDNPGDLESHLYPVPRWLFRESRYWMPVEPGNPWIECAELGIRAGDLVLLEPSAAHWPSDPRLPCMVHREGEFQFTVGPAGSANPCAPGEEIAPRESMREEKQRYGKPLRAIQLESTAESAPAGGASTPAAGSQSFEVVAVGLYRGGSLTKPR